MRKIAIIVGSKTDLAQCREGLKRLAQSASAVKVVGVYVRSQHRNTQEVQQLLLELSKLELDALIVGAGWANHLTGCCDAYLRYHLRTVNMPIIGVAFTDPVEPRHTQAAILSITEVPGTQVIFKDRIAEFIGEEGFLRACIFAATGELPEIKLPEPKKTMDLTLDEAIHLSAE